MLIPPTEEHFDSIRRRGFPNIASALLHRVSCKHPTVKLQNLLKLFPFGYCIFILHKVTVLFVLSLYLYIPVGQLCVFVFGCLGVWVCERERDGKGERENRPMHARPASKEQSLSRVKQF